MNKTILLLLTLILFLNLSVFLYSAIPTSERAALIALYKSTDGDNWKKKPGWKDGKLEADGFGSIGSEGSWYGIKIINNHVTEIDFYRNNLNGNIPKEIVNLNSLKHLSLSGGKMTGIPSSIGNLNNLEYLSLSINQLTSVPASIGNLSNLKYLYLNSNKLKDIPTSIVNLSSLKSLNLSHNCLYIKDAYIRKRLNTLDPDWEVYQYQCAGRSQPVKTVINGKTYYRSEIKLNDLMVARLNRIMKEAATKGETSLNKLKSFTLYYSSFGGSGLMSGLIFNNTAYYTYSWGSGIHRSHFVMVKVIDDKLVIKVSEAYYDKDIFVEKTPDGKIQIVSGKYKSFNKWSGAKYLGEINWE